MPTKTKPVKMPPEFISSTSLIKKNEDEILEILNQKNANERERRQIVGDLETQITGARNQMQNAEAWPAPESIRADLEKFLKSAKRFEPVLKRVVDTSHLRCALGNQGRRNVISYIYTGEIEIMGKWKAIERKGIHADFLELIYQAEQAIKEAQKNGNGKPGKKQKRLAAARKRVRKDLEAKIYEKYYRADGLPNRDRANRNRLWEICKAYIEPKTNK